MPKISVDARSLAKLVKRLQRLPIDAVKPAQEAAIQVAGEQLAGFIRQNMSIPPIGGTADSHAAALADLGHPYSPGSSNRLSPAGGTPGFPAEFLVHSVSGRLVRAVTVKFNPRKPSFRISLDQRKAPHAKFVIKGTNVMYSRDVLWLTATDDRVKAELRKTVVQTMGQVFSALAVQLGD